jgi:hypothetical protein
MYMLRVAIAIEKRPRCYFTGSYKISNRGMESLQLEKKGGRIVALGKSVGRGGFKARTVQAEDGGPGDHLG